MTLATLQHLRSFNPGEHPLNLEPGHIALNMSTDNFVGGEFNYNIYLYVGNGGNIRIDQGGQVLATNGDVGKGWVRYLLRSMSIQGDNVYGDVTIHGKKLKIEATASSAGELVIPRDSATVASGSDVGSVRWNVTTKSLESWDGSKWDSTAKVSVTSAAPANPSEGDMWLAPTGTSSVLRVYVTTGGGAWVETTSSTSETALQPGNGVTANTLNQIELIDTGSF